MGRMRPYQHRRPPRISMGDDRGSSSRCSGVCRHHRSSSVVPFVVSDEEAFDHACKTWFDAPAGRAAEELRSLPKVERERVWADLTGTTPNQLCHPLAATATPAAFPHEDQATVQQALTDLRRLVVQSALEPLRSALQIQPDYICDPNYLIRFLRAKEFDIPLALDALHRHLTMKESLFGRACLTRDLCLDDLTEDDHRCLERGVYQFLPETDRAGRAVSFLNFADPYYSHATMHSVLRMMFYLNTTATESESVQRLGIVRVGYFHQRYPRGGPDQDLIRMCVQMIEAVPIRSVAFYLVAGSSVWAQTMELIVLLARPWLRVRTRIVSGSYMENLYTLLCLGVPKSSFPAKEDGTISSENVTTWIKKRKRMETARSVPAASSL